MKKGTRALAFLMLMMAVAPVTGCAVLTIDVDVYKGPMSNTRQVQLDQVAVMAQASKPMLVQLRRRFEEAAISRMSGTVSEAVVEENKKTARKAFEDASVDEAKALAEVENAKKIADEASKVPDTQPTAEKTNAVQKWQTEVDEWDKATLQAKIDDEKAQIEKNKANVDYKAAQKKGAAGTNALLSSYETKALAKVDSSKRLKDAELRLENAKEKLRLAKQGEAKIFAEEKAEAVDNAVVAAAGSKEKKNIAEKNADQAAKVAPVRPSIRDEQAASFELVKYSNYWVPSKKYKFQSDEAKYVNDVLAQFDAEWEERPDPEGVTALSEGLRKDPTYISSGAFSLQLKTITSKDASATNKDVNTSANKNLDKQKKTLLSKPTEEEVRELRLIRGRDGQSGLDSLAGIAAEVVKAGKAGDAGALTTMQTPLIQFSQRILVVTSNQAFLEQKDTSSGTPAGEDYFASNGKSGSTGSTKSDLRVLESIATSILTQLDGLQQETDQIARLKESRGREAQGLRSVAKNQRPDAVLSELTATLEEERKTAEERLKQIEIEKSRWEKDKSKYDALKKRIDDFDAATSQKKEAEDSRDLADLIITLFAGGAPKWPFKAPADPKQTFTPSEWVDKSIEKITEKTVPDSAIGETKEDLKTLVKAGALLSKEIQPKLTTPDKKSFGDAKNDVAQALTAYLHAQNKTINQLDPKIRINPVKKKERTEYAEKVDPIVTQLTDLATEKQALEAKKTTRDVAIPLIRNQSLKVLEGLKQSETPVSTPYVLGQLVAALKFAQKEAEPTAQSKYNEAIFLVANYPVLFDSLEVNIDGASGELAERNARDVLDVLIIRLRYQLIEAKTKVSNADNVAAIESALEAALKQRGDMTFIRPASAYLKNSYPVSALQTSSQKGSQNMLGDQAAKAFVPFYSQMFNDSTDQKTQQALDKQYWQNINSVRVSGGGDTNYVVAKDDVGNWYVKNYSADPGPIIKSAKNLALFGMGSSMQTNLVGAALRQDAAEKQIKELADKEELTNEKAQEIRDAAGVAPATSTQRQLQGEEDRYNQETFEQRGTFRAALEKLPASIESEIASISGLAAEDKAAIKKDVDQSQKDSLEKIIAEMNNPESKKKQSDQILMGLDGIGVFVLGAQSKIGNQDLGQKALADEVTTKQNAKNDADDVVVEKTRLVAEAQKNLEKANTAKTDAEKALRDADLRLAQLRAGAGTSPTSTYYDQEKQLAADSKTRSDEVEAAKKLITTKTDELDQAKATLVREQTAQKSAANALAKAQADLTEKKQARLKAKQAVSRVALGLASRTIEARNATVKRLQTAAEIIGSSQASR
jgi:hypothetical protein